MDSDTPLEPLQENEGIPPDKVVRMGRPHSTSEEPNLDIIEDVEVLLHICGYIEQPKILGRLACVSSSFGRPFAWPSVAVVGREQWSVVEESARRWIVAQQASCLGSGHSWLRQMHAILTTPTFTKLGQYIKAERGGVVAAHEDGRHGCAALCGQVMTSGRHFATFERMSSGTWFVGVARPDSDPNHYPGNSKLGWMMNSSTVVYHDGEWSNRGRPTQSEIGVGEAVVLALCFDANGVATLSMRKTADTDLLVLASNLTGKFSWAAQLMEGASVKVSPLPSQS